MFYVEILQGSQAFLDVGRKITHTWYLLNHAGRIILRNRQLGGSQDTCCLWIMFVCFLSNQLNCQYLKNRTTCKYRIPFSLKKGRKYQNTQNSRPKFTITTKSTEGIQHLAKQKEDSCIYMKSNSWGSGTTEPAWEKRSWVPFFSSLCCPQGTYPSKTISRNCLTILTFF